MDGQRTPRARVGSREKGTGSIGFLEGAGLGMPTGQAHVVGSVFVFGETAYGEQLEYKDVDCETNLGVPVRRRGVGCDEHYRLGVPTCPGRCQPGLGQV